VTPSVMSGGRFNVMSMLIFQQYMVLFDYNFGAALAILLVVATLVLMAVYVVAGWAAAVWFERRRDV